MAIFWGRQQISAVHVLFFGLRLGHPARSGLNPDRTGSPSTTTKDSYPSPKVTLAGVFRLALKRGSTVVHQQQPTQLFSDCLNSQGFLIWFWLKCMLIETDNNKRGGGWGGSQLAFVMYFSQCHQLPVAATPLVFIFLLLFVLFVCVLYNALTTKMPTWVINAHEKNAWLLSV